jgi:hypothetical protein
VSETAPRSWTNWIEYHATTFGFRKDEDVRMLAEWADLFAAAGYSPAEVLAASRALVTDGRLPQYRTDQLTALFDAARDARNKAAPAAPAVEDRGACVDCSGTGWVAVPHPKTISGATDRWYTCAVLCHCALGRWKLQATKWVTATGRDDTPMTLDSYARMYPDWKERMKAHQELLMKQMQAARGAKALDKTLGCIRPAGETAGAVLQKFGIADGKADVNGRAK